MPLTPEQLERTRKHYAEIAGEPVTVELIGGSLYIFGSELATLRIYRRLVRVRDDARQGWSPTVKMHFYAHDTNLGE